MTKLPVLAVLAIKEDLIEWNCAQLQELIGDSIDIRGYSMHDPSLRMFDPKADLCLVVGPKDLAAHIIAMLHPDVKYIVKERSLDLVKLHLLQQIPEGSDVLMVNDVYLNSLEVIDELNKMGFHSMKMYPYAPDAPLTLQGDAGAYRRPDGGPFQYAVTAGELHLVPPEIPVVVDIGYRQINIMTVADILRCLKKDQSMDSMVGIRYMRPFANLSMMMAKKNQEVSLLQAQLASVIANIENGILLINESQEILIFNESAQKILGEEDLFGRQVGEFLGKEFLLENAEKQFVHIQGILVYILVTEIVASFQVGKCYLISMESMEQLQNIGWDYQKQVGQINKARYRFQDIIYRSKAMGRVVEKAWSFAKSNANILITGESGTGKELLAQAIHNASSRKAAPFLAINCGALTETLLESELFGYEEGAFTGAKKGGKKGLFELTHGGTLFLDEIGDTPRSIQVKLLRALQEKEILRVGGNRTIPVDVRIIAATNQDLIELQRQGLFRQDLYYRLNTLPLTIPPLRQRKEDIVPLFIYLMNKAISRQNRRTRQGRQSRQDGQDQQAGQNRQAGNDQEKAVQRMQLMPEAIALLERHSWPGNVRELENMLDYLLSIDALGKNQAAAIGELLGMEMIEEAATGENQPAQNKSAQNKNLHPEAVRFSSRQMKEECEAIMRVLLKAKNSGIGLIGRGDLQRSLRLEEGLILSLDQIKLRLNALRSFGYVEAKMGKGHYLLPAGEAYIAG
ncbi:MAG: sigma 54-interacting transcriptional regulator [Clostridiales bacterium]